MSADACAELIRRKHVVGTDRDQPAVADFHLAIQLDQTLGLAQILRTVSSPAKNQNHRIRTLQVRKLATFTGVIGQLIIGKYCASYDVRSHGIQPPPRQRIRILSATRLGRELVAARPTYCSRSDDARSAVRDDPASTRRRASHLTSSRSQAVPLRISSQPLSATTSGKL